MTSNNISDNHCIYCGSKNIIPVDDDKWLEQNCHILLCQNCHIMFTELEQKLEADRSSLDNQPDRSATDENTDLETIRKIINTSTEYYKWNLTLELLFQHKYPLRHPIEFMIYRDIWQVRDAIGQYMILKDSKEYDHIYACGKLFDLLINNLENLDYYLQSYDEEQRFQTLKSLSEDMIKFYETAIFVGRIEDSHRDAFIHSILQKRAASLKMLADQLVYLQDTAHGIDYLKMAGNILTNCLNKSYVCRENLSPKNSNYMKRIAIPQNTRTVIEKQIAEISDNIRRFEPDYKIAAPASRKRFVLINIIGVIILLPCILPVLISISEDMGLFALSADSKEAVNTISLIVLFVLVGITAIFALYSSLVLKGRKNKDIARREQICRRLYG